MKIWLRKYDNTEEYEVIEAERLLRNLVNGLKGVADSAPDAWPDSEGIGNYIQYANEWKEAETFIRKIDGGE